MEPQCGLLSPSSHSITTVYRKTSQDILSDKDLSANTTQRPFPSSGFPGDELLNLAYEKGIIGSNGRVQDDLLFNLKENLQDEIQAVATRLQDADQEGEIFSNNPSFKAYSVPFLTLIFEFQKLLGESTPPEIIGGAVSYLLGEVFFISYAVKRLQVTEAEAIRLLEPVLRLVRKSPADIDCRQYIRNDKKLALLDEAQFKTRFSELLTTILAKLSGNQYIDSRIIKNSYFQKLNLAKDDTKRFGMGRFGKFLGGFPLEYLIVDQLPKPYISFHKSQAIEIHPPTEPNGRPRIGLKFYTKSLASADIIPETTFFQQIAMVLDANDLTGIDWRGFLSMMAEATRGSYRTLTPYFFDELWKNFKEAEVDLVEKMQWAAENHLLKRGGSPEGEKELLSTFYLNVCLYLIEREEIDQDQVQLLLKSCKALSEPLNYLQNVLLKPGMELKAKLAWFKIGMWLRFSENIPEGSLSTNYGTLCYRLVSRESQAAFWMPVDLQNACKLAIASLRAKEVGDDILIQLMFIIDQSLRKSPYSLAGFNPWIDSTLAKDLAFLLRLQKDNPHALKIALKIDLARINSGVEAFLPLDWFSVLPEFLKLFPEEYVHFHPLFGNDSHAVIQIVPNLEMITSKEAWIAYLIRSGRSDWVEVGLKLSKELMASPIIEAIESQTLEILKTRMGLSCTLAELPWILLTLALGGGTKKCALQLNKDKELVLVYGHEKTSRTIPVFQENIISRAVHLFSDLNRQESCTKLFLKCFPHYAFEMKPLVFSGEDKKQLSQFARGLLRQEPGSPSYVVGLKIFLILLKFEPSIPMAAEMLKHYPGLHEKAPGAGHIVQAPLKSPNDPGSRHLEDLLNGKAPFDLISWVVALLCHNRKECLLRGEELVKQLKPDEQAHVWQRLYPHLLQYRLDSIPRMITLLNQVSITHQTFPGFFMQWIEKIRGLKSDKKNKELQAYLKGHEGNLLHNKELKNHKGSATDWLAKAKGLIKRLQEKPEILLIEQFQNQLDDVRKKRDSLNDEEFAEYFLKLEIPQNARGDYERILQAKLSQIQVDIEFKLLLFEKYQFKKVDPWLKILSEIEDQALWEKPAISQFFSALLSKENDYGSFFWNCEGNDFADVWHLLAMRYIDNHQIPLEIFVEISYHMFPLRGLAEPLFEAADVYRAAKILNYRARLSILRNTSVEARRLSTESFIRQFGEWDYKHCVLNLDELIYHFWQVNFYFWDTHGIHLMDAVRLNDADCRKAGLVAKVICLIFNVIKNCDLNAGLSAIERVKDIPVTVRILQPFFGAIIRVPPKIEGDTLSLIMRLQALFRYFHYDSFPNPQEISLLQKNHQEVIANGNIKFKVFENVLLGFKDDDAFVCRLLMQALPLNGWLRFLQTYLIDLSPQVLMARYFKANSQPINVPKQNDWEDFVQYALDVFSHYQDQFAEEEVTAFLSCYYHSAVPDWLLTAKIPHVAAWHEIRQKLLLKTHMPLDTLKAKAMKFYLTDVTLLFISPKHSVDVSILEKMIDSMVKERVGVSILTHVLSEWNANISSLSDQEREAKLPSIDMLLEKLKGALRNAALKGLEKSEGNGLPLDKWLAHLTRMLEHFEEAFRNNEKDLQYVVIDLDKCLDVVSDKCLSVESIEEFRSFYEMYYSSNSFQLIRSELPKGNKTLSCRRNALLALVDKVHFKSETALLWYLKDLASIFNDFLLLDPKNLPLNPEMLKSCFEIFLNRLCFSFQKISVANEFIRTIYQAYPQRQFLGVPLVGIRQVALTVRLPSEYYDMEQIGGYLHGLISSREPLKVNRGLYWLSGILESLNSQMKIKEIEDLLDSVFNRKDAPIPFKMEPWMISEGLGEWLFPAIGCLREFKNKSVQQAILSFLKDYLKLYEGIKGLPKDSQLIAYFTLTTLLAELRTQGLYDRIPGACLTDYDQIVLDILKKIHEEYFPQRKKWITMPWVQERGFEKCIFGWSAAMISAMCYGTYSGQDELELRKQKVEALSDSFYVRLIDLAFYEGDRAFLEEGLQAYHFIMETAHEISMKVLFFDKVKVLIEGRLNKWELPVARAFLKQMEIGSFALEADRLSYARDAASIFLNWFQEPPENLSRDEVSLYFKQFIQFLTQKLMDKKASREILQSVVQMHPTPPLLNFSIKSLNTVNLCIDAPVNDYLKGDEDLVNVSRTLYRYVHSKDPLVVDTGFYWLGSLMTKVQPSQAKELLSFVFEKKRARENKFESSSKGAIILEPWMAAYGLSHFLMRIVPDMRSVVSSEIKELFRRYLSLDKGINGLSSEMQIRAYYSFFSVIASLKERHTSPLRDVVKEYQRFALSAKYQIFELFLPNRKEIREKNLFNAGDVNRKIIELGIRIIECVALGEESPGDLLTEMFMRSTVLQLQFQEKLITFAHESGDLDLLQCHYHTMSAFEKKYAHLPNGCVPYDRILPMIADSIQRLNVNERLDDEGASLLKNPAL